MIKLFNKNRKKSLSENRFGKYLLYAIGEIILVVIGILIALQINNNSAIKKERIYEVKMLTEVSIALEGDINDFKRNVKRLHILDSATTMFIKLVNQKAPFKDTIYNHGFSRWYNLRTGVIYTYNPGPYEAIKSSGMDKISNDELRNSLIRFYDFTFPQNEAFSAWIDREYNDDITKLESFLQNPFIVIINGNEEIFSKFPEDLFQNIEFLELLRNMRTRARLQKPNFERQIRRMQTIKDQIDKEI